MFRLKAAGPASGGLARPTYSSMPCPASNMEDMLLPSRGCAKSVAQPVTKLAGLSPSFIENDVKNRVDIGCRDDIKYRNY
jgi:hypothetical protein